MREKLTDKFCIKMQLIPRIGTINDSEACTEIIYAWIKSTDWMPELFSKKELMKFFSMAIPLREVWVIGDPVSGYLSYNKKFSQVVALYTKFPGKGQGKILLDTIKKEKMYLQLWSHLPNKAAHKFYLRESFLKTKEKKLGDDGLTEIQFEWGKDGTV